MMKKIKVVAAVCLVVSSFFYGIQNLGAVSEEEFQSLKNKVQELEKYTFPPEKAEEIKKVTEYVCPQGHTYAFPPEHFICPEDRLIVKKRFALIKMKLDRREAVGDKISSMLDEEFQKRVNVAISGTGIVQHIAESLESATKKQTFAQGSIDVYLLSRPFINTLFFIDIESQGGQGPDSSIPNQSVLNNDTTSLPGVVQTDQVRLREAWLQKTAMSQKIQFIIGKIDLTNYFDRNRVANDETSQFITGGLVNNLVIGNAPNGPGMALLYDSHKGFALGIGAQSADGNGVNVTEEPFSISEIALRFRLLHGALGNIRFWAARNGRTVGEHRDDYSLGTSLDQEIGSKMILFGRVGRAIKKEPVRDPHFWSAGLMLQNFIPARRRDKFGIGYSHFLTPIETGLTAETENIGECYYSIFLSDHLNLSPNIQTIFHSAGSSQGAAQSNVLILGLRTQITF
ncbi:MAG: hypothetical protein A2034_02120 [Elusimicrobia bacterium GWA2_38_7]|nr:MAG: hypothetical protein A2034_02120 [Elusimicrobia bacterium GWA2_38_7]